MRGGLYHLLSFYALLVVEPSQQQRQVQWEATLGPRLCAAAAELAALASKEQLGLFLGAGASVGAGLPRWQALLTALAERDDVPLSAEEMEEPSVELNGSSLRVRAS